MRAFVTTFHAALILWVAVFGKIETSLFMAIASAVLVLAFRPMPAARAITGWARASVTHRGG